MSSRPRPDTPEGTTHEAREPWPSEDLIHSWLGDSLYDFQFRPGEEIEVEQDDQVAVSAARRFREVLGRFASGVTVVTAMSEGAPVGMTCQSFSSVSLNPPLVLFIPARTSRAWPAIQRSGTFCVNLLAHGQEELSNRMASRGVDKYADLAWSPSPVTGSPLLPGTLGHVDCTIHAVHPAGDHDIVIGRVLDLALGDAHDPLLFFEGQYRTTD